MGMTMIEKILAKHSGKEKVRVGEIVVCEVSKAVQLDIVFATPGMDMIPERIADPDKVAVILDHTVPAPTINDAKAHIKARNFVKKFGIKQFFDVGNHGICHQVILENGLARPGEILACTDSHTCASGAFNCASRGLGPVEMLQIICTGKAWYKVAPTIKYVFQGEKPENVFGKDIFLHIAGKYGSAEGHNVEFTGEGIASLTIDDRATIATMCAEISAEFATFEADEIITNYLKAITDDSLTPVFSDSDAEYASVRYINLSELKPYVAKPDFVPNNTVEIDDIINDQIKIDQAFVGSCANGKLEDLRIASKILEGKKVAEGVRLIVTPASQKVYKDAVRLGYVGTLVEAGAIVTNSTCGACYGGHMGLLGPGETCITSSTRNFKGRMGSPDAKIYIGSSATVAASAIKGYITTSSHDLKGVVQG